MFVYSSREWARHRAIHDADPDDQFGLITAPNGDVNGDGLPDLTVTRGSGEVAVISGTHDAATSAHYGSGWSGVNGSSPAIDPIRNPVPGSTLDLALVSSRANQSAQAVVLIER